VRVLAGVMLLVAACAAPPSSDALAPEPERVTPPREDEPAPRPSIEAYRIMRRLEGVGLWRVAKDWPAPERLPKPDACYGVAMTDSLGATDGWCFGVLVDLDDPRVFWVFRVGSIAGIIEYRGPAEILDDSGPLVLRVGER
jgi:hypothetical protein